MLQKCGNLHITLNKVTETETFKLVGVVNVLMLHWSKFIIRTKSFTIKLKQK